MILKGSAAHGSCDRVLFEFVIAIEPSRFDAGRDEFTASATELIVRVAWLECGAAVIAGFHELGHGGVIGISGNRREAARVFPVLRIMAAACRGVSTREEWR